MLSLLPFAVSSFGVRGWILPELLPAAAVQRCVAVFVLISNKLPAFCCFPPLPQPPTKRTDRSPPSILPPPRKGIRPFGLAWPFYLSLTRSGQKAAYCLLPLLLMRAPSSHPMHAWPLQMGCGGQHTYCARRKLNEPVLSWLAYLP